VPEEFARVQTNFFDDFSKHPSSPLTAQHRPAIVIAPISLLP
jgi:hypothetical protein